MPAALWQYLGMFYARRGSCSPAWLAVLLLLSPLSAVARGETRNVLVLSSSERPFAPQSGFANALVRDLIRSSREPIQFVDVSVQAARASDEAPGLSIARRIESAFGGDRLDLVITIGGTAATFAQQFRQELFPATPMLIAGVDRRFVENAAFTRIGARRCSRSSCASRRLRSRFRYARYGSGRRGWAGGDP